MNDYREIPGCPKYEINREGIVRKTYEKTTTKIVKTVVTDTKTVHEVKEPVIHRGKASVNMVTNDGKKTRQYVEKLMNQAFPERIPGKMIDEFSQYYILDNGNVYSLKTATFMNPSIGKNGYRAIEITGDDKSRKGLYIHRLVATAYVDGYFEGAHVNHIDGNKLNNAKENLEWVTNQENRDHAWKTGLMNSKLKACTLSKDGIILKFDSLVEAKEHIDKETNSNMVNAGKLTQCAKNNESGQLNRGLPAETNPFKCKGYAVRYAEQEAQQEQN